MRIHRFGALALAGSLVLVSLGSGVASTSAFSSPLKKVTFAYDFPGPDFELTPLVVAQDQGFFRAAGLNVKIVFPPNTSTTTKLLVTGNADIGMVTTTDMGVAINAGVPMVSVANYSMKNNWALFAKPGVSLSASSLKATLKGKRIFSYGDTWTEAMLPFIFKYAGLSPSQVNIVTNPTGNDLTYLLAGKVNFSANTTNYEIPGFQGSKVKGHLTQLLGTTAGAPDIPIWVYAVSKSYAKANATTLRAFLSALKKATVWAVAHQTKAASEFTAAYPKSGYSAAYSQEGWNLTVPFLTNSAGQYFTQTNAQWTTLAKALKNIKLITSVPAASSYYTNKFLP